MGKIDDAIAKYAGEDDAYALTLKRGIREAMGYSNYMARLGKETAAPAQLGDLKGLDPAAIQARIGSKFGIQDANIRHLQGMMDTVDSAAGSIAASRAAADRAAQKKKEQLMGLENGVAFTPENLLEKKILEYMQNPKNADGSVKSLQQFESELNEYYKTATNTDPSGVTRPDYDPNQVKAAIQKRVPADYIGNEDKYYLMSKGYSIEQATENAGALKYDTLSKEEKQIYDVAHPQMAKLLNEEATTKNAIKDSMETEEYTKPDGTKVVGPKYTYEELRAKYPNVPETDLKTMVSPMYKKDASQAIEEELSNSKGTVTERIVVKGLFNDKKVGDEISQTDLLQNIYDKKDTSTTYKDGGFEAIKKTPFYKELHTKISNTYAGILTGPEIESLMYETIMSKLKQQ